MHVGFNACFKNGESGDIRALLIYMTSLYYTRVAVAHSTVYLCLTSKRNVTIAVARAAAGNIILVCVRYCGTSPLERKCGRAAPHAVFGLG
jgi:hypothetical protein